MSSTSWLGHLHTLRMPSIVALNDHVSANMVAIAQSILGSIEIKKRIADAFSNPQKPRLLALPKVFLPEMQ